MFTWGDTISILVPVHTCRMRALQCYISSNVNHAGLSESSWYKKAIVPMFIDGVLVNFIESLHQLSQCLKIIQVVSPLSSTTYCDVIFDCEALNPVTEVYQGTLYGVISPIDVEEAKTLCENGYKTVLHSLVDEFSRKRRSSIKHLTGRDIHATISRPQSSCSYCSILFK